MKASRETSKHILGVMTLALALTGCSASASFQAGAGTASSNSTGRAKASNSAGGEGRGEAVAESRGKLTEGSEAGPTSAPSDEQPKVTQGPEDAPKVARADHDRGHGNDRDGVDQDNPGKGKKGAELAKNVKSEKGSDHNRGHGNDADGVDQDNPGASKKMVSADSAGNAGAPGQAKVETKEKPDKEGKKAGATAKRAAGDHDRGHGNDADGVDEDNPGKSRGK